MDRPGSQVQESPQQLQSLEPVSLAQQKLAEERERERERERVTQANEQGQREETDKHCIVNLTAFIAGMCHIPIQKN